MNFKSFAFITVLATILVSCGGGSGAGSSALKTEIDSVSYCYGYLNGNQFYTQFSDVPGNVMNLEAIEVGFYDGLSGAEQQFVSGDREMFLRKYFNDLRMAIQDSVAIAGDDKGTLTVKSNGVSTMIKDRTDSACYLLGYDVGFNIVEHMDDMPGDALILDLVSSSFQMGITNDTASFDFDTDPNMFLSQYFRRVQTEEMEAKAAETKKEMDKYLSANKEKDGVMVTESGLQYEIITEGNGPKPTATDRVKVHYHGTTIDGNVFDSSVERGSPATFGVNQVIAGWTEALQLMPVGSKWKLTIPSDLAYGDRGAGADIGPGAALIFEVELLEIVK